VLDKRGKYFKSVASTKRINFGKPQIKKTMTRLRQIISAINKQKDPKKAKVMQRFFKTDKGEYGEGDVFLGLTVPEQRMIAREFRDLSFFDVKRLLESKIHEHRLIALLILVDKYGNLIFGQNREVKFPKGSRQARTITKQDIYDFYLKNTKQVNNWDLVDSSAEKIVGRFLYETKKSRQALCKLAKSKNLWERRIAIISTFYFIKNNLFADTLKIAGLLLNDSHDLIHKAVGWMLREVGKRDEQVLIKFLRAYYHYLPRTALRYAIEKFPEGIRKKYLEGKF